MKTMFTEEKSKIIPKDFNDCIKEDNVSSNLWLWGERLEKLGKILFIMLIVVGIIISITTSIVSLETEYGNSKTSFNFKIFIGVLLEYAIYAIIEYCAYHILALLVCSLGRIVQSSKITAALAIYNSKTVSTRKMQLIQKIISMRKIKITQVYGDVKNAINSHAPILAVVVGIILN